MDDDAIMQFAAALVSRKPNVFDTCTKYTCSVKLSIYGYFPNLPANAFFVALFGLSMLAHIYQGIRWKSWTFGICMTIGTFGEAVGYYGRIMLHKEPFDDTGFKIQIICLTVAPAFLAAGIYLTLKHSVIVFGESFSRIRASWYTWLFCGLDLVSICVQAMGAGIAAGGSHVKTGNNIMIFGLAFQVLTLSIFGVMGTEYGYRVYKFRTGLNAATTELRRSFYFKGAMVAIITSYVSIFIRCIYRVAEMAGGWRNRIMQDEIAFIVLDSVMCSIAVAALNFFHPGFLFQESNKVNKSRPTNSEERIEMSD